MEFLIVSGLSGGGKSRAADVLEELDFYCVDNMPTALLTKFAELWHARKICTLTGSFTAMPRAPSQRGLALSAAR